jgi:hypothetical protein
MVFLGIAAWISIAPLYLFASGIFETDLKAHALIFGISTLIVGAVLFHMYEILASKVRYNYLACR